MATMVDPARRVVGGVDTHKDVHVVAVVDEVGRILDLAEFPTTARGHGRLLAWLRGFGTVLRVGVEGQAPTGRASPAT